MTLAGVLTHERLRNLQLSDWLKAALESSAERDLLDAWRDITLLREIHADRMREQGFRIDDPCDPLIFEGRLR